MSEKDDEKLLPLRINSSTVLVRLEQTRLRRPVGGCRRVAWFGQGEGVSLLVPADP
jgi:hypothetical protein